MMVKDPGEFEDAFAVMNAAGDQAVIIQPNFLPQTAAIVALAAKHRLAILSSYRDTTRAGGLMSYSADHAGHFKRAATFVDKILKGAKPADLPIEQPTKFELVVNLKTAKALALEIPPTLLARADEVMLLGGATAAWPIAARAQQPAMPVIGLLSAGARGPLRSQIAAFEEGLKGHPTGRTHGRKHPQPSSLL
jgi:hypothetical protein